MDRTFDPQTLLTPLRGLTPDRIAAAPVGAVIHDDKVCGLHVRVFPNRRVFYLYYRTKLGQERRPKLGESGILTLTQAREIARTMLRSVAAGTDPVEVREQHRTAPTVSTLWATYRDKDAPQKSKAVYERLFQMHVKPVLGERRVTTVTREDIERIHVSLSATPFQANRVLAILNILFAHAVRGRCVDDNPASGIRRYPEHSRERYATPEEARALLTALAKRAKASPRGVGFILLCLFTGARPEEIARARPEWISGTALRLPDSKTGRRTIHLSPQALGIIAWLKPHAGETITGLAVKPRHLWQSVVREAGVTNLRLYDLRHTFASAAIAATGSLALTGRLLGHVKADTTLVYAHLMTDEGADAATRTGARIEQLLGEPLDLP